MTASTNENKVLYCLWLGAIGLVFVTPALTGLPGLILLVLVMLATGLYLTFRYGFSIWIGNRFSLMLTIAFGLIALAFLVTMRTPDDLLYLSNFLGILIGPPLLFLSSRQTGMEWAKRFVMASAIGAIIIFVVSVFDIVVLDDPRAHGVLIGGPNRLGQLALLLGTISLGGLIIWRDLRERLFLILAAVLSSIAVILAGSRGVAIAAIPTVGIAIWFAIAGQMHGRRIIAIVLLVAAALVSVITASVIADQASTRIFTVDTAIQQVIDQGYSTDSNIEIRLNLYQSAIESFQTAPLAGMGWKQALELANARVDADRHLPRRVRRNEYPHLHSDILGYAGSMGLLGLVAFGLLVAAPWTGLGPKDELRRFRSFLLATMVGVFHFYALTDVSMLFDISIITYVALAALIVGTFKMPQPVPDQTAA